MDRSLRLSAVLMTALSFAVFGCYKPTTIPLSGPMPPGVMFGPGPTQNPQLGPQSSPRADLIGKAAPDFTGDFAINGEPCKLSDLKGKVVVVDFWAVWCGPCIGTFPHMIELNDEYKDKGLEIVGVTTHYPQNGFDKATGVVTQLAEPLTKDEEQAMLKDFAAYHKLKYRLMTLPSNEYNKVANQAYGATSIPEAVIIDRKGNVRLVVVGGDLSGSTTNKDSINNMVKQLLDEKSE